MKILSILLSLSLLFVPANKTFYMENKQEIFSLQTYLYDKDILNTISIWGSPMGEVPYIQNIEIKVFENNNLLYSFCPKTDFGYSTKLTALDFKGNGLNQIFYSADSGGSGGYGFFYVFDLSKNMSSTLFDYETFSNENKFEGKFLDEYRATISGNNKTYILDVSQMDEFFKNTIYSPTGKVLKSEIDIGDVNTVFPYFNSTLNIWLLQVYQKTTAVAQVNVLGYAVTNLLFDDGMFNNFWSTFSIY